MSAPPNQPKEEQFEVAPKLEDLQKQVQFLTQQNITLRNVLQGLVITLDKISRSQSTNIGTITNSLENILQSLPKTQQEQ